MRQLGWFAFAVGVMVGLLGAIICAITLRLAPAPVIIQTPTIPPDITVFISERSLSRLASETLQRPAVVDFDSNGEMIVTTRLDLGWLRPVVNFNLSLGMQSSQVVSELHRVNVGFLTIPARWLPDVLAQGSAMVGQIIQNQTPPNFVLVGLITSPEGVTFQLKWVGE
jgi:hypothetical protein